MRGWLIAPGKIPVADVQGGPEGDHFRIRQARDHAFFQGLDLIAVAIQQGAAVGGQRDDQAAPVSAVAVPLDEPPPLQGGDHVGH